MSKNSLWVQLLPHIMVLLDESRGLGALLIMAFPPLPWLGREISLIIIFLTFYFQSF